jgi:hypothetical protein
MAALESVRCVAAEYGLQPGDLKPCIAYHLDGKEPFCDRHKIAFAIAIELRRIGRTPKETEAALAVWASKIGYPVRHAQRAVKSAFAKTSTGKWRYHPPGLDKRPGTGYFETLQPICAAVGCPALCPAFAGKYKGPVSETFQRFEQLGWPLYLRRKRWRAAIEVYRGICTREKQLGLAPGVGMLLPYNVLAEITGLHKTTVGPQYRRLEAEGLIQFEPGGGSGPYARDRKPSKVRRVVPIPASPGAAEVKAAIRTGRGTRPDIGRRRRPGTALDRGKHPDGRGNERRRHYLPWGGLTTQSKADDP